MGKGKLLDRFRKMTANVFRKIKPKEILQFFLNPRLVLCVAVAWLITNGWSYVMFSIGAYFGITWMTAAAGAYLAFLWLPISPEKLVTFAIALALLRWFFPNDKKTLAILKKWYNNAKTFIKIKRAENIRHKEGNSDEE